MDLFLTKEEKIENLEKKIQALERKMDRNFLAVNESFDTFRKIIVELQKKNVELEKDKDFLLEKYKEVIRKINAPVSVKNVIEPIKEAINENKNLIKDIVLEDIDIEPKKKNIEDLFELVMRNKKITLKSAARHLDVTENHAKYWALKLQKQGLIKIAESPIKTELMKP